MNRSLAITLSILCLFTAGSSRAAENTLVSVEKTAYGTMPDGAPVDQYTMRNAHGTTVRVIAYGAIITSVETPDRHGKTANITLNCDTLKDYLAGHPCFGCIVGRYANRIGKARFNIDGVEHRLAANNGPNHIHGGKKGFDKCVWRAEAVRSEAAARVTMRLVSPDGDEGYPGELSVTVSYSLDNDDSLRMEYSANTTKPTHVNLTNHAYWNLAGAGAGDVLGHELTIHAQKCLPVDDGLIPTGPPRPVRGTALDFTRAKTIGRDIAQTKGGYDHCYALDKLPGERLGLAARVVEPRSGRVMEVYTTQPGVQLYTANGMRWKDKSGAVRYGNHGGFCLETQHYPDAPNRPEFSSTLLKPGEAYREVTIHKFSVQ